MVVPITGADVTPQPTPKTHFTDGQGARRVTARIAQIGTIMTVAPAISQAAMVDVMNLAQVQTQTPASMRAHYRVLTSDRVIVIERTI
jgi:hypothetical protein